MNQTPSHWMPALTPDSAAVFYRECLQRTLDRRKEANFRYSLRAFARDCGLSPSGILGVLGGQILPEPRRLRSVCERLNLPPDETLLAVYSVRYQREENAEARANLFDRMTSVLLRGSAREFPASGAGSVGLATLRSLNSGPAPYTLLKSRDSSTDALQTEALDVARDAIGTPSGRFSAIEAMSLNEADAACVEKLTREYLSAIQSISLRPGTGKKAFFLTLQLTADAANPGVVEGGIGVHSGPL